MSDEDAPDTAGSVGRWMAIGAWIIVLALGTIAAQRAMESRAAARAPQIGADDTGRPALRLSADRRGHYSVVARVNGQPVEFLVDTGATEIALPGELAERLGLPRGRAFTVATAAGPTTAYATRLASLQVGPFTRADLPATISPAMPGEVGLLGMRFLGEFDLLQRSGQLTLQEP